MKQEIERLREEIRGHEYRYYVENAPTISDQEFDALMHQLIKLEAENPDCFDPNSPTQRVGSDLAQSGFEQVEHRLNLKRTPGGITIIDDAFNHFETTERQKQLIYAPDCISSHVRPAERTVYAVRARYAF